MTPEGKVKKKVVERLDRWGLYHFFPATHGYGRSGVPDIICCAKGQFIGLECKATESEEPTDLQLAEMRKIETAGGMAMVVHANNIDEVFDFIDAALGPFDDQQGTGKRADRTRAQRPRLRAD
jgi:Holliday junction resolvase